MPKVLLTALLAALLAACGSRNQVVGVCAPDRPAGEGCWLVLLTTRELEESGLLDRLVPRFEQQSGARLRVKRLPLTTARALDYAGLAGVDVVLLPAGAAFDRLAGPPPTYPPYQRQPFPTPTPFSGPAEEPAPQPPGALYNERRLAFWSELVIVAPAGDPLDLYRLPNAAESFKTLANFNGKFYVPTQEYEPGLAQVEQRLWSLIGRYNAAERGPGYRPIAADSAGVLRQAAADQAYSLTPLATYLTLTGQNPPGEAASLKNRLQIGHSGDIALFLPYELALPNNTPTQDRNVPLARRFAAYLTGPEAQETLSKFLMPGHPTPPYRPYYAPVYVPPLVKP